MSSFHELYGELTEAHMVLGEAYKATLTLLQDIKIGKVRIEDVTVREDGWDINTPEEGISETYRN